MIGNHPWRKLPYLADLWHAPREQDLSYVTLRIAYVTSLEWIPWVTFERTNEGHQWIRDSSHMSHRSNESLEWLLIGQMKVMNSRYLRICDTFQKDLVSQEKVFYDVFTLIALKRRYLWHLSEKFCILWKRPVTCVASLMSIAIDLICHTLGLDDFTNCTSCNNNLCV